MFERGVLDLANDERCVDNETGHAIIYLTRQQILELIAREPIGDAACRNRIEVGLERDRPWIAWLDLEFRLGPNPAISK